MADESCWMRSVYYTVSVDGPAGRWQTAITNLRRRALELAEREWGRLDDETAVLVHRYTPAGAGWARRQLIQRWGPTGPVWVF